MDRKAMIEKIKGYKRAQRKNMGLGSSQKKCTTCPVCGTRAHMTFMDGGKDVSCAGIALIGRKRFHI